MNDPAIAWVGEKFGTTIQVVANSVRRNTHNEHSLRKEEQVLGSHQRDLGERYA
jgi:hypothetical protein